MKPRIRTSKLYPFVFNLFYFIKATYYHGSDPTQFFWISFLFFQSFGKNEQLCGWSLNTTPSSHAEPPQPKRAAKKQRGLRTTDKPSTKHGKWQNPNVGMCNNKSQIDFEYTFQHHTDTSQYMSVYRRTKLAKIYDMFSDDIEEMLNQRQPEICADLAPAAPVGNNSRRITGGGSSIYISSPVEQEEYPMTYRVENRRRNKDR